MGPSIVVLGAEQTRSSVPFARKGTNQKEPRMLSSVDCRDKHGWVATLEKGQLSPNWISSKGVITPIV